MTQSEREKLVGNVALAYHAYLGMFDIETIRAIAFNLCRLYANHLSDESLISWQKMLDQILSGKIKPYFPIKEE